MGAESAGEGQGEARRKRGEAEGMEARDEEVDEVSEKFGKGEGGLGMEDREEDILKGETRRLGADEQVSNHWISGQENISPPILYVVVKRKG